MSASADPRPRQRPRLVVGIGASAGGLDACRRLLAEMPGQSGMALVVVMHLDPGRERHMAEILRISSPLAIVQAAGEQPLEPDHVYVIAPDTSSEVQHGSLHPRGPRQDEDRAPTPVDDLLSSLARDQGERAVGVILSGTGSDGSSAIRELKAHGGLCLVQAPETAEFEGMPEHAIATGLADYVVPPEEMPEILLGHAERPNPFGAGEAEERADRTPRTAERPGTADEELRSLNEELQSLNEELQSSNEELKASKEELQSLNEEMVTINRQLEDKNAELRLANSDLNNLLVSADIPIIFLDHELRVRRFTPATTDLMRLTESDVGRSIGDIEEGFEGRSLVDDARKVLENLSPVTTEVRAEDGHWYARKVLPYRTQEDRIDGVCVAFHDATQGKEAAREIDEARIYAETIVNSVPTPLVVLDRDSRVVSANEAFYETFRLTPAQTEGSSLYAAGHGELDLPGLRRLLKDAPRDDKETRACEEEDEFGDIGRRVMRFKARLMHRENRPDLVLLAIEDVTGRRAAERVTRERAAELAREHRRKDEFLAMLGHELRNPLSALIHGVDLLGMVADDPARLDQIRAMMMRQARRIASMLDQLLDIARLTAGKIQLANEPVDLAEAARSAVEAVTPLVEARGHELGVSLPPEGRVRVRGDLGRLTQVVENLLGNAAKYTEEGGKIDLVLESDEDRARVRVRDTGIGMDAELLPHVFELFTQAPRTLERAAGGLGLGLPLVKRVVELHGGTVEASSPGRGQGSEFVVTLPRLRERPEATRTESTDAESGEARPRRILVVDDEEDSAAMLTELLATRGHESRAVHDGPAALEAVRRFHPDVVLLDLGLPGMDGYEVARRLRDEHAGEDILLVALTGYQKDAQRLQQAGFDHHLIKPPDMEQLFDWIAPGNRARA